MPTEQQRKQWANLRTGWFHHSPICTCERCEARYAQHNASVWCACQVCVIQTQNRQYPYQSNAEGQTTVASVNFCDRCNSMGKSNAMGHLTYSTDPTQIPTNLEICPGCVGDFMQWLKDDIMTDREKGYREPWKKEELKTESGEFVTKKQLKKWLELEPGGDDAA